MSEFGVAAQAYVEEAHELLLELEEALLELDANPEDTDNIAKAFRAMHTIKGSGAMFGFEEIARFTHDVETAFDRVRSGEISISKELLSLTLSAKDHITVLLGGNPAGDPDQVEVSNEIIAKYKKFLPAGADAAPEADASPERDSTAETGEDKAFDPSKAATFWVRYKPASDTMLSGTRPLALIDELSELGKMRVFFQSDDVPNLADYNPDMVYGEFDVIINTDKGEEALQDVFIFVEDEEGLFIKEIGRGSIRESDISQFVTIIKENSQEDLPSLGIKLINLYNEKLTFRKKADTKGTPAKAAVAAAPTSIRVDSARLDKLVNMVGEMVIIQSRLSQAVQSKQDEGVVAQIAEDLERLTDEMRDNTLGLRMLPIGTMYSAFRRLVHDLSANLEKQIELVTEGAETELDKTVIDKLKDPLVHILRNSLDHGIESPETRALAGKSPVGRVRVSASHSAGDVVIAIEDDGKGLDPEQIRNKAIEKGIITPEADLDETEIFNLIFEPGFSTANVVSDVSGRGVGMDVVKKSIDALRGSVEIRSEKGVGTTLSIRLPLTLAIIDGFNVLIGEESYIVPLATLRGFQERFVESTGVKKLDTIERMGDMIPCVSLRQMFDVPGDQPQYERIVITDIDGAVVGFTVDQVVGRQQAVIKSLDESFKNLKWISGTTINGDGTISLILDIPQLVRFASRQSEGPVYS